MDYFGQVHALFIDLFNYLIDVLSRNERDISLMQWWPAFEWKETGHWHEETHGYSQAAGRLNDRRGCQSKLNLKSDRLHRFFIEKTYFISNTCIWLLKINTCKFTGVK